MGLEKVRWGWGDSWGPLGRLSAGPQELSALCRLRPGPHFVVSWRTSVLGAVRTHGHRGKGLLIGFANHFVHWSGVVRGEEGQGSEEYTGSVRRSGVVRDGNSEG